MDLVNIGLTSLTEKYKPEFINCIIAVTFDGRAFLIKAENNLEEAFDGSDLDDNLTNKNLLPIEAGIYKCVIRYHSYKYHHPQDPVEWDCNVSIESWELVEI